MQNQSFSILPLELKALLEASNPPILLDVRTEKERNICHLGGVLIPLQELAQRYEELDSTQEIIVYCHHGVRSAQAAGFLLSKGFEKVRSLSGGIERWSLEVDPSVSRY